MILDLFNEGFLAVSFGYSISYRFSFLYSALPVLVILSILWTAWDPTYHSVRKAKLEGRALRITGKTQYIVSSGHRLRPSADERIIRGGKCWHGHLGYSHLSSSLYLGFDRIWIFRNYRNLNP
jgi:hypothetical protein